MAQGNSWPEQEIVSAWLKKYGLESIPFEQQLELQENLTKLRRSALVDTARLDWIHAQLKMTIAYALNWGYTPQDTISFRAKLDDTILRVKGRT